MEKECNGLNVRGCARAVATVVGDGRERGEWGCGQSQCGGGGKVTVSCRGMTKAAG